MVRLRASKLELALGATGALTVFLPGFLAVSWFVIPALTQTHEPTLQIYLKNSTDGQQPLVLDPTDVEQRLPAFAKALRTARTEGTATIRGESEVRAIEDYVRELDSRGIQRVYVEFEGSFFRFRIVTP